MKKIEIRHRWTYAVLYAAEVEDDDAYPVRTALRQAVSSGADLTRAYLTGANLTGANLTRAYLTGANLTGADLSGAYLTRAKLSGADLSGADLTGANLSGADLSGADLTGAYLTGAYLTDAKLSGADLTRIRDDIRAVLDAAPAEVGGLLAKLRSGEVDGTVYAGPCACLVGTIANLRGCDVWQDMPAPIMPNASRPAERFFLGIGLGTTPETNPIAAIVDDWICEFLAERGEGPWIHGDE